MYIYFLKYLFHTSAKNCQITLNSNSTNSSKKRFSYLNSSRDEFAIPFDKL